MSAYCKVQVQGRKWITRYYTII